MCFRCLCSRFGGLRFCCLSFSGLCLSGLSFGSLRLRFLCFGRLRRFRVEVAVDAKRRAGCDDCDKDIGADTDQLSALFLFCDIFLTMGFSCL